MFHAVRHENNDLYHRATHDALTGLANRALFYDRLRQGLARAGRRTTPMAVLSIGLDGLKGINDNLGHRAGDSAIRETGARLSSCVRESDTTARLGGDEFAAILDEIDGTKFANHRFRHKKEGGAGAPST